MNRLFGKMYCGFLVITTLFLFHGCVTPSGNTPEQQPVASSPDSEIHRVGYINVQRLVNESEKGKVARDDFQNLVKRIRAIPEEKLKEVKNLQDLIKQKWDEMAPVERDIRNRELQKIFKDYQRLRAAAEKETSEKNKELISAVLKVADSALVKVAKRLKYTIILKDPDLIGYLDPKADITDLVLQEMK